MISKTTPAGTTTYTYDFENRLIEVKTTAESISYVYDPFGRRIFRATATDTTQFIHDGWRVLMEKDDSGNIVARYIHGAWIDEILKMERGSETYYYFQDGIGSVVNLSNSIGDVVESYTYDVYGLPNGISSVGNPHLFTGREYEVQLGLYYSRARYYSPQIGRFLSLDPIRFLGGVNFYKYVDNNPVIFLDPYGLKKSEAPWWCFYCSVIESAGDNLLGGDISNLGQEIDERSKNFRRELAWNVGTNLFFSTWSYALPFPAPPIPSPPVPDTPSTPVPSTTPGEGGNSEGGGSSNDEGGDDGGGGEGGDNNDGGGGGCDPCVGDPTFIQRSGRGEKKSTDSIIKLVSQGFVAKLSVPYQEALVRGEVPIFGLADAREFKKFEVEYGSGVEPQTWTTIFSSITSQTKDVTVTDLDDSGDTTIQGNLATWDTGLNYVYLPSHPADHPIDLKGTYTVRLVVTGKDGQTVEDRVTVDVADVIPNAWGGTVVSTDQRLMLTVPEQAIRDSFRLIGAKPVEKTPATPPMDHTLIGSVYALREPGERFTKEVTLTMKLTEEAVKGHDLDSIGIYGYDEKRKTWEHLNSRRPDGLPQIETTIRALSSYYALMASTKPGEGSITVDSTTEPAKLQRVSAGAASGPYLIKEDFEQGTNGWSNRDGDVGATAILDKTATFDGTQALKITNPNGHGNFAVNVGVPSFDAREYPIVQFDYRVPPGVKTNFLVKVAGRWYDIGFTDDPKEFRDKRVNISDIGKIEGVIADDSWRTARFNLYEMMRTKTGHTFVEEMIMADWDVGGYMKLQFGKSSKGASYYIDNFIIGRDPSAGLRLDEETILVDHFNRKKSTNALGGAADIFSDGKSGRLEYLYKEDDAIGKGHSLSISFDVSEKESYAGYITELQNLDLRGFHTLTFYVKTPELGQDLLVGLKDQAGQERKIAINAYLSEKVVAEWRRAVIPLAAFSSSLDWSRIQSLSFSFEHARNSSAGTVLLDQIEFHRALQYVMVDDFESQSEENLLANRNWTFTHGAAAINGQKAKNSPNGIYALSYGGNIGDVVGHDRGLNYTGWATGLGGVDCSKCETLSFRIRGADGGERPNLYLSDGTSRWGVDIEEYVQITPEWQEARIPLKAFSDYGIDLTHLDVIEVVFEWEKMSGTVYLDEIRLGDQKTK
ncbi:MAG: RHS repeat-associated core domain-containing protein [Candidatus Manganitrophus sp.]|nr:RHS repeat-associated core domain-containing protein [Candidatus Manganitrophus sp.]WDT74756.1 MAG: RHS repeat-associated core domain-containing protein [Candidatus Manganitrophus sp.]